MNIYSMSINRKKKVQQKIFQQELLIRPLTSTLAE